jgi:hypothetical protein
MLVATLAGDDDARVLVALLDNPRLVESDALRLATRGDASLLAALAAHRVWRARRSVRLALIDNPSTPVAAALSLLRGLSVHDLRALAKGDKVRRIIRIGAERTLARGEGGAPCGDRSAAPG